MTRFRAAGTPCLLICFGLLVPSVTAAEPLRWQPDYNTARGVAQQKNAPLVVVVGSEACIYCRKQDATTLRDPALVELLNAKAVLVKVDGVRQPAFVEALKVTIYPTTVIATPEGKVVSFLQGYVTADQLRDHVKGAANDSTAPPEWAARDYATGEKCLKLGDAARALALWRNVAAALTDSTTRTKAVEGVAAIERSAAERLARGQELEAKPDVPAAVGVYAEVVRRFAGTAAAAEATTRLTAFAASGEGVDRVRLLLARELLAAAQDDIRRERLADGLDRCSRIARDFPDLPEGRAAQELTESVEADPARLTLASGQLQLRVAEVELTLAEGWLKAGDTAKARGCLERVGVLAPDSRAAEVAAARLARLAKPGVPAMTTGFQKTP